MSTDEVLSNARETLATKGVWMVPKAPHFAAGGGGAVFFSARRELWEPWRQVTAHTDEVAALSLLRAVLPPEKSERELGVLKVAHPGKVDGRSAREVAAMQAVRDPALVQLFDADAGGDSTPPRWFVMEYVAGGVLHDQLALYADPVRALKALAPLARVLGKLHNARIIHRDIKTKNIFVRGSGDLVLGDLGIALIAGQPALTDYEAPASKDWIPRWPARDLDTPERDIYQLARVLFALLSGDKHVETGYLADALAAIPWPSKRAQHHVSALLEGHIVDRRDKMKSTSGAVFAESLLDLATRLEQLFQRSLLYHSGTRKDLETSHRFDVIVPSDTDRLEVSVVGRGAGTFTVQVQAANDEARATVEREWTDGVMTVEVPWSHAQRRLAQVSVHQAEKPRQGSVVGVIVHSLSR